MCYAHYAIELQYSTFGKALMAKENVLREHITSQKWEDKP